MTKKSKILSAFLAPIFLVSPALVANNTANYSGNTGILETPNARIMPDWSMRMFINQDKPFTYYGFAGTPLPFLEANFHMTQLTGLDASDDYGEYKDKSLSLKLLLQEEREFLPSVVFGGDDIWGTGLYTSKYIALGKQIGYFDFTLGYAKGRLGGQQIADINAQNSGSTNNNAFSFMKDLSWGGGEAFGSVVFSATPELSLMAEYSPINYEKDRINPFLNGSRYDLPDSNINYGAKYALSDTSTISLSFQRGNQLAFGYTYQFGFSRNGMFDHIPDPKWRANEEKLKQYENLDEKQLSDKLANEVAAEKLSNVQTSVNENKIWVEFDNPRYDSDLKAMGRAISTIDEVAPKNYDTLYATLKQRDVPLKTIKVNRQEYDAYENGKVSHDYFQNAVIITNSVEAMEKEFKDEKKDIYKTPEIGSERFTFYVGPEFKTYLNAVDKPFAMKVSAMAMLNYDITKGLFIKSRFSHPLYNSIQDIGNAENLEPENNSKLSIRSNMIDYYKYDDTQMQRLTTDYVFRAPLDSMGKIEVGYLDFAFAGTDLEWYKSFYDDKFGLGLQYQYVYKRPIDEMFGIESDLTYDAKFVNAYYLLSEKYDMHMGLKVGQFLAGDKGVKVDFSRHYKGFTVGAYATFTNSDEVFTSSQNKGYIDKGIYIQIPIDVFTYKNVKGRVNYGISPWTRDVGQYAGTSMSLYPMSNSENNIKIMKKDIQKIIE
jgi:hypothetical protein